MKISNHDLWMLLRTIEDAQDFRSERSPEQKMECLTDALEEVADILLKMNGQTRKTVNPNHWET